MSVPVPKLRFKDENEADFADWEKKQLGDFLDSLQSGKSQNKKDEGLFPFYGSTGLIGYTDDPDYSGRCLLVARVGANAGALYPVDGKYSVSDNALMLKVSVLNCFDFFRYLVEYANIGKLVFGSGQPLVTGGHLKSLYVNVPTLFEQTKIANFLTTIDDYINQLTRKHELLTQYKKAVMQQIFSQQLRFKDESGEDFADWEEVELSEIGDCYSGLSGKSGEDFGGGSPYISYKQVFDSRIIDDKNFGLVSIAQEESQNLVSFGDILLTVSSETAKEVGFASVYLGENGRELYLNSFCFGYRLRDLNKYDPIFMSFFFRCHIYRSKVMILAQGSTRYNISKSGFLKLRFGFPKFSEQTKIANFLTQLDQQLDQLQQQIDHVKQYKQGLLQQMFV